MIGRMIGRMASVTFGFAAGLAGGGATLLFLVGERWAAASAGHEEVGMFDAASQLFDFVVFAVTFSPALAFLSPLLVVTVGEVLRIRSLLYYVAASGLAAAALPMATAPAGAGSGALLMSHAQHVAVMATAGFAAGLSYWLVAGRRA